VVATAKLRRVLDEPQFLVWVWFGKRREEEGVSVKK